MATTNPNTAFGFQWIGGGQGAGPVTGAHSHRPIQNSYTTMICRGDLVSQNSSGYIGLANTGSVPTNSTFGIFEGVTYYSTAQGKVVYSTIWPTSDHSYDGTADVIPLNNAPAQEFKVMTLATPINATSIGQSVDINVGTQTTLGGQGYSGMTVDAATLGANAQAFIVVDVYSNRVPAGTPGTNNTINNNIVIVSSNPYGIVGV